MPVVGLDGIVDANHAREIHSTASGFARSRSGGAIQALGSSICAFSAVQKSTALSTYEAELYALVLISRTLLAQRRLAEFLLDQTLPTSVVGCDNESTLKSLRRRDLTARNRHIRVYLGFILDAIDSSEIRFEHRVSHLNEANTLTIEGTVPEELGDAMALRPSSPRRPGRRRPGARGPGRRRRRPGARARPTTRRAPSGSARRRTTSRPGRRRARSPAAPRAPGARGPGGPGAAETRSTAAATSSTRATATAAPRTAAAAATRRRRASSTTATTSRPRATSSAGR